METKGERERVDLLLREMGKKALRSFGQNFLLDGSIADKIVNNIPKQHLDKVLEIGPGLGVLTERILERGASITAVEKDVSLSSFLEDRFSNPKKGSFKVINDDILNIIDDHLSRDLFIVSNLPFNISSRFTGSLLDGVPFQRREDNPFKGAIIMYQEEFAGRLISRHGRKDYGRLSVMFESKMDHSHIIDVPRNVFYPIPKVNARVLHFYPREDYKIIPDNPDIFGKLVHVVFLNRRKKMKNSVNPRSFGLDLEREDIRWILDDMDLTDRRPEEIPPEIFIELSNRFTDLS